MEKLKVLFHIDEMEKWNLVLVNANNFLDGREDSDILVVANSVAVKGYLPEFDLFNMVDKLHRRGVLFSACSNALKANNISKDDIGKFIKVVPAGVIEIAKKQREGYSYIKP